MYINFQEINPILINSLTKKFNLDPNKLTILYKITNIKENKFDEFEKSLRWNVPLPIMLSHKVHPIAQWLFFARQKNVPVLKLGRPPKISTEDMISSIKMKINKNDIYKMYNNLNSLFTIFEDDFPQSQVKIMALYDTPKQKTLKYAYIKGSLLA